MAHFIDFIGILSCSHVLKPDAHATKPCTLARLVDFRGKDVILRIGINLEINHAPTTLVLTNGLPYRLIFQKVNSAIFELIGNQDPESHLAKPLSGSSIFLIPFI